MHSLSRDTRIVIRPATLGRLLKSLGAIGGFMVVVALAVLWLSQPAQAAQVIVTMSGVTGGIDWTGAFGFAPGSSFTNQSFKLVFTIDDSKGRQGVLDGDYGSYIENVGLDSPLTAVLTINGHSVSFGTLPVSSVTSYFKKRFEQTTDNIYYSIWLKEEYYVGNAHGVSEIFVGFDGPSSDYHWAAGVDLVPRDGGSNFADYTFFETDSKGKKYNYTAFDTGWLIVTHFEIPAPPSIAKNLGPPPCPCACGDPVNAATGDKFEAETDYVGGPATGLAFTRYYNSQDPTGLTSGIGWHSTPATRRRSI